MKARSRWKWSLHHLAFSLALILLTVMGWQVARVQQALLEANAEVGAGLEYITLLQDLQLSLLDVETGSRGFVITGRSSYLQPYEEARGRLDHERAELSRFIDEALHRQDLSNLARLNTLIDRRIAIAEINIRVRESDGLEAAALRSLAAGGRETMEELRQILGDMEALEQARLAASSARAAHQAERFRWTAGLGAGLVLILLLISYLSVNRQLAMRWFLMREVEHREARLEALLRAVPDDLMSIDPDLRVTRLDGSDRPVSEPFNSELVSRRGSSDAPGLLHSFLWHDDSGSEHEVRMVPSRDGSYLVIARDVTDLLRTRRHLDDQKTFLRRVVDADENLIFARDEKGRFLLGNDALADFLGLSSNHLEGRFPAEFANGHLLLPLMTGDSELFDGLAELRFPEVKVQDALGRHRWLQVIKRLMRLSDGSRRLLVVAVDITERREMERMKTEFISTVSHELRTPLTAIRGALRMLTTGLGGTLSEDARSLVSVADTNSERLVRLINDILDIEKLEAGQLSLVSRRLNLRALVEQALTDNRPYAEAHEVSLELAANAADGGVEVDPDRFAQVMANLLSNACKHSPSRSRVTVSILPVTREGSEWLEVTVSDSGEGIPPAFQPRIFDRFAQADGSDRRRTGGTGLGLAITRDLIHAMGGRIDFTSAPGEGTQFRVRLPRHNDDATTSQREVP